MKPPTTIGTRLILKRPIPFSLAPFILDLLFDVVLAIIVVVLLTTFVLTGLAMGLYAYSISS
jgi:hypothetical protein